LASSDARRPVFVVTGPSGAGKGTLIAALLARMPELETTISATTRAQRPGEEHGREYWFLDADEFERRVRDGAFLEHVSYVGNRYGTLRSEIERIAAGGGVPVLELETEGALNVKETVPNAVTIFITAPIDELQRRLEERATESSGQIDERVALARDQLEQAGAFDHVVQNDDRERATRELLDVVQRELAAAATMAQQ
jgi:guanylate kinase